MESQGSVVSSIPAADPAEAARHFESLLRFETDCWDVHVSIADGTQDFVLLDVRSADAFAQGHIPGARNIPNRRIDVGAVAAFPEDALFVVYCDGPHCNGADRAALRLSRLDRRVKKMIGGVTGWLDDGFTLVDAEGRLTQPAHAVSCGCSG